MCVLFLRLNCACQTAEGERLGDQEVRASAGGVGGINIGMLSLRIWAWGASSDPGGSSSCSAEATSEPDNLLGKEKYVGQRGWGRGNRGAMSLFCTRRTRGDKGGASVSRPT